MKKPTATKLMTIFSRNLKLYNGQHSENKITIDPKTRDLVYISMLQLAREVRSEEDMNVLRESFGIMPKLF